MSMVLVVDDEALTREVIAAMLDGVDIGIETAASGSEALEMVAAVHPDLVLLDMTMPDLDGTEVCRRLKADPALADVRVVMLTAHADALSRAAAQAAGADGYLVKPFSARDLFAVVEGG